MWRVGEISASGTSFLVYNGTAELARSVVDPQLPWVVVEGHQLGSSVWSEAALPLSERRMREAHLVRARFMQVDLLFRTDEFLERLSDLGAGSSGGMVMWQFVDEPVRLRQRLCEVMFEPGFDQLRRGVGARLGLLVPHRNEVSSVSALSRAEIVGAYERVRAVS